MQPDDVREMVVSALRELLSDPARVNLIWRRLPALVVNGDDPSAVSIIFSGSDEVFTVPAVSLIGPVSADDQVMVDCVPPSGAYIIGQSPVSPFWDSDWHEYNPDTQNGGSATFSVLTGAWQRIYPKTVSFVTFLQVNNAGSGASVFQVELPTEPSRVTRQVFVGSAESGTALPGLHGVILTSGTDKWIDRIRYSGATNVTGADLTAGKIITIQGVYREL